MFNENEAIKVADKLGIKFDKFSFDDFFRGLNIEIEHGWLNPSTNVTSNDIEKTAKIALAHLNEYPNYYNKDYGLIKFEEFLTSKL